MAESSTSFSEDKQPEDRKPRGKGKRQLFLDALESRAKTELEFYEFCIDVAMGVHADDGRPDQQMLKEVLSRLYQVPKAVLPTYDFKWPDDGSMVHKADSIINAVGLGDLPIDAAKIFMDIIASRGNIEVSQELADRVAEIEKLLEGKS